MILKLIIRSVIVIATVFLSTGNTLAQPLNSFFLVDSNPAGNASAVHIDQSISLRFSESIDQSTIANSLSITSNLRGQIYGHISAQINTLTFQPIENFYYGEWITLTVLDKLKSTTAHSLATPVSLQFLIATNYSQQTPAVFYDRELIWDNNGIRGTTAAADIDKDSDIDLIYSGSEGLMWLENKAANVYEPHSIGNVPPSLFEIQCADIDLDGDMDILFADFYFGIGLFVNDGMRNFEYKPLTGIEVQSFSLAVADFNSDGLPDIVYSNASPMVDKTYILYNQGGNSFTNTEISNKGGERNSIADLDNDGDWDILQCEYDGMRYFVNNGTFTFDEHQLETNVVYDMAIADFNEDGNMDIAAAMNDSLVIHFNLGGFQFAPKKVMSDKTYGVIGLGDMDGDGDVDLVVPGYMNFYMLVNDGLTNFTEVAVQNSHSSRGFSIYPSPLNIGTADLDRDGDLDFFSTTGSNQFKYYENVDIGTAYPFTALDGGIKPQTEGDADWGDYDNDGDLDLIVIGISNNLATTTLYENQNGIIVERETTLPGLYLGSCDWGDYDNDGDLDLLLMGATNASDLSNGIPVTLIFTNNDGVFALLPSSETQLPKTYFGNAEWADLNNDGWLDIIISSREHSSIYQSDGKGNFLNKHILPSVFQSGNVACADYDHDGDIDLAFSGWSGTTEQGPLIKVFRNDGSWIFTDVEAIFSGRIGGNISWADIENDGDLDLVVSGNKWQYDGFQTPSITVYENQGGFFRELVNNQFLYFADLNGTTATGDFDNDGITDVIASTSGGSSYAPALTLLNNDGFGELTSLDIELPAWLSRTANWADYDQDQDLDIFVHSGLLRNNNSKKNTPPTPPSGIQIDSVFNNTLYFHWLKGSDLGNEPSGLSYQIYMGTQSMSQDVVNSNSNLLTGKRKVAEPGNSKGSNTYVSNLTGGNYFFGIQSIDAAFEGSAFSNETVTTVISVHGDFNVCKGSEYSYVANPTGNYTWQVSGGTIVSGQGTEKLVINWNTAGRGKIEIFESENLKNTLVINVDEKPEPVLFGDETVCTGIEQYTIENSYSTKWAIEGAGSILEEATSHVKVDWVSSGIHKIIAQAFSKNGGCSVETHFTVAVDERPLAIIQGPMITCTSQIDIYETTDLNTVWGVENGTIIQNSQQQIQVRWPALQGSGQVNLTANSSNGYCATSSSYQVNIYPKPAKPVITIKGDTLFSSPSPIGFYRWYFNNEEVISGPYYGIISEEPGIYMVEVFADFCSTKSDPMPFLTTGIEDREVIVNEQSLFVHPNPTDRKIVLEIVNEQLQEVEISIYTITNSLVKRLTVQGSDKGLYHELDVSELTSGMYILSVKSQDKFYMSRFIKQ